MEAMLCYVDGMRATFATIEPLLVHGDDFNDVPYEHNASGPYSYAGCCKGEPYALVEVLFELDDMMAPCDYQLNSQWSVDAINSGAVAWLARSRYANHDCPPLHAGTTLTEFVRTIRKHGGTVYRPMHVCWGDTPEDMRVPIDGVEE